MKYLDKIIEYSVLSLVFLIPWQARWIISVGEINGGPWEYGTQSVYVTEILLAAILVLVIIKWIVEAAAGACPHRYAKCCGQALLLFLIYAGLSVFWAIDKDTALIHWRWLVEAVAVMLIIALFVETRYVASHGKKETPGMASVQEKIQWAIILSAVIQAIWGIGQWLMQSIPASTILGMAQQSADVLGASVVETLDGRWLRAYGSFPHPNILGGFLVLGLVILIRRCCLDPQGEAPYTGLNKYKRFLPREYGVETTVNYVLFIIILFGLLTTFSRSAWLAFGAALLISLLTSFRESLKIILVTVLVATSFVYLFPQPFLTRLNNNSRLEYKSSSERQASLSEGWEIIKTHPLIGVGVGNYGLAVHRDIDSTKPNYYYQPTHNVFLLIWAELGLLGLLFIAYSLGLIAFKNRKTLFDSGIFLLPLFIMAMLDHYLWSLYSGLMIIAIYLANISRK